MYQLKCGNLLIIDSSGHYADSAPSGEGASSQTQATNQYQQINQPISQPISNPYEYQYSY